MPATKVKTKPEVVAEPDYSRGSQRFILKWDGYDKELFEILKVAGAKYAKTPGATKGYIWCLPYQLRQCVESAKATGYTVHCNEDLDHLALDTPTNEPKIYEIIKVTDRSVVLHFEFGPKFRQMVDAIKRIDVDEREFDPYTKDWRIKHTALTTLIWGWEKLGIIVTPLKDIQRLVN